MSVQDIFLSIMHQVFSYWLCLAPLFFLSSGCAYTSISTRQHQVVFRYFEDHISEKDLPLCSETSVCSVLHKRYWLPPIAERLCRCPSADECPWKWNNEPDNQTMLLNNRAQLKFCTQITTQQLCSSTDTALTTHKSTGNDLKASFHIRASCYCPPDHHWRHSKTSRTQVNTNSTLQLREEYKCSPLKRCHSLQTCGNVRTDHNSIYYSCSCPVGHYCVYRNKTTKMVDELLYKGPAYQAVCEPIQEGDYDY